MEDKDKSVKYKRDSENNIIANRRGVDHEPNEPFDIETDPIRTEEQPLEDGKTED